MVLQADKKLIMDYQQKVEMLQEKVAGLEASLDDKEREISGLKHGEQRRENVSLDFKLISCLAGTVLTWTFGLVEFEIRTRRQTGRCAKPQPEPTGGALES